MQLSQLLDLGAEAKRSARSSPAATTTPSSGSPSGRRTSSSPRLSVGLCPARVQCLAGALDREEPWGVWGGQLLVQGAVVPRKRPRGRPRKHPIAA